MTEDGAIQHLRAALIAEGAQFFLDTKMERFRAPFLAEILACWQSKCTAEGLPFRRDFTPQSMRPFLSKVALFEIEKGSEIPFRIKARLTGPEFRRAFAEMSLKYVDEVVPRKFYPRWKILFEGALTYRRPLRVVLVPVAFGREHSVVELLLAPLLANNGDQNQFLVALSFEYGASWEVVCGEEAAYRDG